jgi:DNA polymerase III delta prime subunit
MLGDAGQVAAAVGWVPPPDYRWTRGMVHHPLPESSVPEITGRIMADLAAHHVNLPGGEALVRRCVYALLVGHLVLQGPPGTGKTTLARALARGFRAELDESTATSDWTPYHVVGGFRPNSSGGLTASYGKVTEAVLHCAETVRSDVDLSPVANGERPSATWLLIDEFNRADIDKAIGSLFTVLTTCDPDHLDRTPIDVWFEAEPEARRLWMPARFRIIAAMNDLDTSFVNRISQGLTRRMQFVTIGVPTTRGTGAVPVTDELESAFRGAYAWLGRTYGSVAELPGFEDARSQCGDCLLRLQQVADGLRSPTAGSGWPVGTAQLVDVLRFVLLRLTSDPGADFAQAIDDAVAIRVVPQMAGIDDEQEEAFGQLFADLALPTARAELKHLINPHNLS